MVLFDGPLRPGEVADRIGFAAGGKAKLLKTLEDDELLERRRGEQDDLHAVTVELTPEGCQKVCSVRMPSLWAAATGLVMSRCMKAPQVRTAELPAFLEGMMGQVLRSADRYSAAVELAGGSVGTLEDAGRLGEAGFNAAIIADVEASQGHFDEAARWIARGAALAEASGNPNVIADVELMKGRIAAARGELEIALTHTRPGMETAEGAGNIQCTPVGNFLVADKQLRRGDAAAAIPHLERTFELGAYCNAEAIVGLGNAWLASARAHLGDLDPKAFSGPLK